jgi:redox-sensitive bicupin YhaK (pirin superfamily)
MMAAPRRRVTGGFDTHADTNVAAVLDTLSLKRLDQAVFATTAVGHQAALESGQLAVLRSNIAATLNGSDRAIVLGGEPVGKRTIWWNFVHSDPDRIEQAKSDWSTQNFPHVPDDHQPYVPLPG